MMRLGIFSVKLSDDGMKIVFSSGYTAQSTKSIRIYKFLPSSGDWNQLGGDIVSLYTYDSHSAVALILPSVSVHINEDGSRIAFGSNYIDESAPGQVQVFEFDTMNENWSQLGATISASGSKNGDGFGQHGNYT